MLKAFWNCLVILCVLWPSQLWHYLWHLLQHLLFGILRLSFGCVLWGPWPAGSEHSEGSPDPLVKLWTISVPCGHVFGLFEELWIHSCGLFDCQPTVTAVLCKVSGLAETLYGPLSIKDEQGAKRLSVFCPYFTLSIFLCSSFQAILG